MDDAPRPITEHLDELRRRLFWGLGAWALCAAIAGYWAKDVFEILMNPAVAAVRERGHTLIAVAPPELFFTYVKSAILAGFIVSIPVTLYQVWAFIAPGLYPSERRFAAPFVLATTLLFLSGCLFGYVVAFPFVFEYFLSLEADYVTTSWTTQNIFSFMSRLYVAFGLSFQLPIAMFFLSLSGIVSAKSLASGRRYAFVVMFVAAAILTPPDVVSQVFLALPLVVLYEGGIWVSRLAERRRTADDTDPSG
jgi:sec-independent protein translocase protein TatC